MGMEPYLFIFLNTSKYKFRPRDNNPDKCFNNIEKGREHEYSTFPNKVRHHSGISIVTNSNDSVTLRLMTEHDLAML